MPTLSYQLFTARKFDLEDTFALLARHGIPHVEGFVHQYADPRDTRRRMDRHGLTMPTGHFPLDMVEADPDHVIGTARILGITGIIVPVLPPAERPADRAGWQAFATRLGRAAAPLRAAGFEVGWHNNDFEFTRTADGCLPIEEIAQAPGIRLELDLCWIALCGFDPGEWVTRYADRLMAIHLKDAAPAGENPEEDGWADIGQGRMDYPGLADTLLRHGPGLWVIEHDAPTDQGRFLANSLATLGHITK